MFKRKKYDIPIPTCKKHKFRILEVDRVWEYKGVDFGGRVYYILSCVHQSCDAMMLVDRGMWQPKFIGKTVKIEGNNA